MANPTRPIDERFLWSVSGRSGNRFGAGKGVKTRDSMRWSRTDKEHLRSPRAVTKFCDSDPLLRRFCAAWIRRYLAGGSGTYAVNAVACGEIK
ncbi:MAG: hypothetical protein C3F11_11700 [Methylocystaceae bacterium]|nr:MAG: hypothetical protein C3F11_11700 [Methylocystaceae bacterium]